MDLNLEVYPLSVESAKNKRTLIIDAVYFFYFLSKLSWSILAIFSLWRPSGGLLGPCYGLLCPTGLHMELGPQVCHFRG